MQRPNLNPFEFFSQQTISFISIRRWFAFKGLVLLLFPSRESYFTWLVQRAFSITLIFTHDSLSFSINNNLNLLNPFLLLLLRNFSRFMWQLLSYFGPVLPFFFIHWTRFFLFVVKRHSFNIATEVHNVCNTKRGKFETMKICFENEFGGTFEFMQMNRIETKNKTCSLNFVDILFYKWTQKRWNERWNKLRTIFLNLMTIISTCWTLVYFCFCICLF